METDFKKNSFQDFYKLYQICLIWPSQVPMFSVHLITLFKVCCKTWVFCNNMHNNMQNSYNMATLFVLLTSMNLFFEFFCRISSFSG